jgi:hypothetical protein
VNSAAVVPAARRRLILDASQRSGIAPLRLKDRDGAITWRGVSVVGRKRATERICCGQTIDLSSRRNGLRAIGVSILRYYQHSNVLKCTI